MRAWGGCQADEEVRKAQELVNRDNEEQEEEKRRNESLAAAAAMVRMAVERGRGSRVEGLGWKVGGRDASVFECVGCLHADGSNVC